MKRHPVLSFLVVAYLFSWGLFAASQRMPGGGSTWVQTAVGVLYMWGPAVAVLVLRRRLGVSWAQMGLVAKGIRWKWMGLAALMAVCVPVATLFYNWVLGDLMGIAAFGHTEVSKAMALSVVEQQLASAGRSPAQVEGSLSTLAALPLNGFTILMVILVTGFVAGSTVNLIAALGEELGWRGLLLHLTRRRGLVPHVLFTGVAWGLWHAPLILKGHNYPDHPVGGVFMMCALTTAMALPLAWVRIRSGCVWAAALLHGTLNGVAGAGLLFHEGGSDLAGGPAGVGAVLALLTIGAALFLLDPHFRKEFATA